MAEPISNDVNVSAGTPTTADRTQRIVQSKHGRFILQKDLGKGGFAFVKQGQSVETKNLYALKFMKKKEQSRKQRRQVATEIQALQKIRHPNVLRLFDYNTDCTYTNSENQSMKTILLVLELATGGDLFDLLYYSGKLSQALSRTYFKQLMSGLKALHNAGIVHRDLKPQNLLLDHKFRLKITDFGLAKVHDVNGPLPPHQHYVMQTRVGTSGFKAPEQLLGRQFTEKIDIFSCGIILFILINGYPPCDRGHVEDPWYKWICLKNYPKFWGMHARADCALKGNDAESTQARDLLQCCLAYQPRERYDKDQALAHPWLSLPTMSQEEVILHMKEKKKKAAKEKKRKSKANKKQLSNDLGPKRTMNEMPPVPAAGPGAYLPLTTTFALSKEEFPFGEEGVLKDLAKEMNIFKQVINARAGAVKQGSHLSSAFWEMSGHCKVNTKKYQMKLDISCRILTKVINGEDRYLFSYIVKVAETKEKTLEAGAEKKSTKQSKTPERKAREAIVDWIEANMAEHWDEDCDLSNVEQEKYDNFEADFQGDFEESEEDSLEEEEVEVQATT